MTLDEWAVKWRVPPEAIADLRRSLHPTDPQRITVTGRETDVNAALRLEASKLGMRLWRNNVGVALDIDSGRPIRYGLANDSKAVNKRVKSGDLIGIRPVRITLEMVGTIIGQFVSREDKRPGWKFTGTEEEMAQLAWAELILAFGGDAAFATGTGTL